jgi:predicted transcriptional regulator of viral defense system
MLQKRTNLYQIRDKALRSGRAVFSVQQLANLIGKSKAVAKVYLGRMAKSGLGRKVLQGKISFSDDDFAIASQLYEPSYISFSSALYFHGLLSQVPAKVECATTKNSRSYPELGLYYHRLPPALFFGFSVQKKGESYVMIADKEKAVLDMAYLNMLPRPLYREIAGLLDKKKLATYAKRFNGRGEKKLRRLFP